MAARLLLEVEGLGRGSCGGATPPGPPQPFSGCGPHWAPIDENSPMATCKVKTQEGSKGPWTPGAVGPAPQQTRWARTRRSRSPVAATVCWLEEGFAAKRERNPVNSSGGQLKTIQPGLQVLGAHLTHTQGLLSILDLRPGKARPPPPTCPVAAWPGPRRGHGSHRGDPCFRSAFGLCVAESQLTSAPCPHGGSGG